MPIARNPQTGEVVALDEQGQWVPTRTAVNPQTNETLAYDGTDWVPVGAQEPETRRGSFLPLSSTVDPQTGEVDVSFDPQAGIIGDILRAFDFGSKAASGEIDLTTREGIAENIEDVVNLGLVMSPVSAARGAVLGPQQRSLITGRPKEPPAPRPTAGAGPAVVEAGERIGVEIPGGAATDVTGIQQTGRIIADIPVVGTPLRTAAERARTQMGEAATAIEQDFGTGRVPRAGEAVREGITTFVTDQTKRRVANAYDRVDSAIDDAVMSPLTATQRTADDITRRRANARTGASNAVNQVGEALEAGNLNYQGIKDLRTSIGEMLDTPSLLPANTSQSELRQIYGALTDDLRSAAKRAGGAEGQRLFDRANALNAEIANQRKRLNKVLGRDISDEQLFDRITAMAGTTGRANLKQLQDIRQAVGRDTFNEMASAVLHRMGRDAEGAFSPQRFTTAWGRLSPQGKNLLFRSGGRKDLSRALDDLAAVSSRFKELEQFANVSRTGSVLTGAGGALNLATLDPVIMLGTLLSGAGGRLYSTILSKPSSARAVANWAKAYERTVTDPRRRAREALQLNAGRLATLVALEDPEINAEELASALVRIPESVGDQETDQNVNAAVDGT